MMATDYRRYRTESLLGATLAAQKRFDEAEPVLLAACEGMKQKQAVASALYRPKLRKAWQQLIAMYESWGKPDLAAERRAELPGIEPE